MEVKQLPLSSVFPSPMNPRKTFDEAAIQELADNIERQGLLQPITVRPVRHPSNEYGDRPDKYEIVCGERRYRALCELSKRWSEMDCVAPKGATYNRFSDIAAIVREMSDDEAFDAMITENLQRKDVDPIEEAFAFSQLIQKGNTAEEVAARFGKSIRFVQDRVKLNNLIPDLMRAVRDGKMPIVSAMMIAKLDDENQGKFFKQYGDSYHGLSKTAAEGFLSNLFMTIDKSIWYRSGDKADEDFEGSCGRKCSECTYNTANHGCLFWEMKSNDAGRCTDRARFDAKTLDYQLSRIDAMAPVLVRENEPLAFGKTVLCIRQGYIGNAPATKERIARLREAIAERGYQVVDPDKAFSGKCIYGIDDERTQKFLEDGKCYRCISLWEWGTPEFEPQQWYVRTEDNDTIRTADGKPYKVQGILDALKREENALGPSLAVAGITALSECKPVAEPLTDDERVLMLSFMLVNNFAVQMAVGLTAETDPRKIRDHVAKHPETWAQIMHGWLFAQMRERNQCLLIGEPLLDDLGRVHCPDAYKAARDKVTAKFNRFRAKCEKNLKALGYGLDGKPLATESKPADMAAHYEQMKKKHPESVLLFRVGDFYECIKDDAKTVADVLSLTITKANGYDLAGFPAHALDSYLPRLIRAGKKVAICESLDAPKKWQR